MVRKYVIAIDPGKMTGVGIIDYTYMSEIKKHASYELGEDQLGFFIEDIFSHTDLEQVSFEVVMEAFKITAQTGKNSDAPWSLKYLGVMEFLCKKYGIPFTYQTPAAAKNFVPNPRLKALNMWHVGGGGHANDALRHAVLYLVEKKGWRPSQLLSEDEQL